MTAIIGISSFYHDSAAALLVDGRIVAAAQEERFTRKKHDPSFPANAIRYLLETSGLTLGQVQHVAFYDKPFLKFERLIETYVATAPMGLRSFITSMPIWLREKLFQRREITKSLQKIDNDFDRKKLLFAEHHLSHAASAFYPSPFEEAVVLTLDGVGEWATTTVGVGRGKDLKILREIHFPHSLGLLYSAFTYYVGLKVNSGEYKLMGLAPYGAPIYKDLILNHLIDLKDDGSFRLDMTYFNYLTGLTMTNEKFDRLFGHPARKPETEILTQFHMDVAASIQAVTEEVMLRLARSLASEFDIPNLCLAGGVALNCVANGKVLRDGAFKEVWIQPAAGDAGGAVGAALAAWHCELGNSRTISPGDAMSGGYLGPEFPQSEIQIRLANAGARFTVLPDDVLVTETVDALVDGHAVGWFQGRMEFGPRALGNRSILGDPRNPQMQSTLNLKIKYRESFRPFAPSVLREDVSEYFELTSDSPYMLLVADVSSHRRIPTSETDQGRFGIDKLKVLRSDIPSVTHVDYSARVQTVHVETNPRYHSLISAFKARTGYGVVVNTSFNVRGEPIVHTPEDAFRCFMGTEMETLVVGNCLLRKKDQNGALLNNYASTVEMD